MPTIDTPPAANPLCGLRICSRRQSGDWASGWRLHFTGTCSIGHLSSSPFLRWQAYFLLDGLVAVLEGDVIRFPDEAFDRFSLPRVELHSLNRIVGEIACLHQL